MQVLTMAPFRGHEAPAEAPRSRQPVRCLEPPCSPSLRYAQHGACARGRGGASTRGFPVEWIRSPLPYMGIPSCGMDPLALAQVASFEICLGGNERTDLHFAGCDLARVGCQGPVRTDAFQPIGSASSRGAWRAYADRPGKPGWIIEGAVLGAREGASAPLRFRVRGSAAWGTLFVEYLRSYDVRMGRVHAWLGEHGQDDGDLRRGEHGQDDGDLRRGASEQLTLRPARRLNGSSEIRSRVLVLNGHSEANGSQVETAVVPIHWLLTTTPSRPICCMQVLTTTPSFPQVPIHWLLPDTGNGSCAPRERHATVGTVTRREQRAWCHTIMDHILNLQLLPPLPRLGRSGTTTPGPATGSPGQMGTKFKLTRIRACENRSYAA